MIKANKFDAELRDLWSRRRVLDEAGWTRLYEIVVTVLMRYRPSELSGLREDRDIYIIDFFMAKVFRPDLSSQCDHAGALRLYYQRYLRDLIRSEKSRLKNEVEDRHDPENSDSPPALDYLPEGETDDSDPLVDLERAGLSPIEVATSAAEWLESNEEWVRFMLAFSFCPDAERSEPMMHLAKRKGIKSYHSRAEKLGCNWKGGDIASFGETLIGGWIATSLEIKILPENYTLILLVLKILCFEALSWVDQQESPK